MIAEHRRAGLGRVSRIHDRELGRDVAIKELLARGRIGEARFLREALITACLEHPGIVPVHPAYMAPEQKPGESVDQRADVFVIGAMWWSRTMPTTAVRLLTP